MAAPTKSSLNVTTSASASPAYEASVYENFFQMIQSPHPPPNMEQILTEPYEYLAQIPGKGVRSALMMAFNEWFQIPADKLADIQTTIDMLHVSSLLIDDIEDNSQMRRGVPVAHKIYGIPAVINCANYMYFLTMDRVNNLGHPDAVHIFLEEMLQLHRGQGLDMYWRDNVKCPTQEQYQRMVLDKTGGLFRLAVKLMQLFSDNKDDFMPLINTLSLFYQVRDDYLNLHSKNYHDNKGYCEDLTEGKFSFPVIHAILADRSNHVILNVLRQRTEDRSIKAHAVKYMEQVGSFTYTNLTLERLYHSLLTEIANLGGNPLLEKFVIKKLGNWNEDAAKSEPSASDDKRASGTLVGGGSGGGGGEGGSESEGVPAATPPTDADKDAAAATDGDEEMSKLITPI